MNLQKVEDRIRDLYEEYTSDELGQLRFITAVITELKLDRETALQWYYELVKQAREKRVGNN